MRQLFAFLLSLMCFTPVMAQSEDEQVLVFRNTGEVNLFYSSELDSVVCSHFDVDSVWHEETVSQVFYGKDTTLVVPLAEVDSVCFGNRNEIVFHPGVHQLEEQDTVWLIRYDGNSLFFRSDTPERVLPKTGEKLFAQQYKPKLPLGICAQVDNVTMVNGEWKVDIHDVELSDIFERLFYAGKIKLDEPRQGNQQRIAKSHHEFKGDLRVENLGGINFDLNLDIEGHVVVHPLQGFYCYEADIVNSQSISASLWTVERESVQARTRIANIPLGVYALVFTPNLTINGFVELSAELSVRATFGNSTSSHISWVKRRGEDPVFTNTNQGDNSDGRFREVDVTLEGEWFTGCEAIFDFNIFREIAGARLKIRVGPSLDGEFGIHMLDRARDYSPEVYGKAQIRTSLKALIEGSAYIHNPLHPTEDELEQTFFRLENRFFQHSLALFPHFFESLAVQAPPTQQPQTEVTTATKTDSEMLKEVEVGFQLLDEQEEVKDSVFVGIVQPQVEKVQGFNSEFKVKTDDAPKLMRPVIHYAGRTIPAATTKILSNVQIQPILFDGSNGAVTYVASYPFMGEVTKDSTNYRAGAYIPIPVVDSVFVDKGDDDPNTITVLQYLDDYKQNALFGTWHGFEGDKEVTYVFNADATGTINGRSFTYQFNQPRSGQLLIRIGEGDEQETIVMSIVNLQEQILQYRLGQSTTLYMLTKTGI